MKKTYLIECHTPTLFSSGSIEIRDANETSSHRTIYEMERESWTGDWEVFQRNIKVARAVREGAWFSADSYKIHTSTTSADLTDTSSLTIQTFSLDCSPKCRCEFVNNSTCCGPTEYDISIRHPSIKRGRTTTTMADVTECCGSNTFCVTLDDRDDAEYLLIFLTACSLIQYYEVKKRRDSSAAAPVAAM